MIRTLFAIFVILALLGDARIFLFFLNRVVFGGHRVEKNPWILIAVVVPLLTALTLLFWPLNVWIERLLSTRMVERLTPAPLEDLTSSESLARVGMAWLLIAAFVGVLWIVDRLQVRVIRELPVSGVETRAPVLIRMRRAHIPFATLRKLGAHNDVYDLEVTHHDIFVDELPKSFDGYRIAFLTDTHVASFMRRGFYRTCIDEVNRFGADLVLFGGDFVTWRRHIPLAAELLTTGLTPRDGMYAVLGNHDYWAGSDEVLRAFSARGVRFLTNATVRLSRGADTLPLAGIDERYRGKPDVAAALASIDPDSPCIAISHHPDIIDLLDGHRIDLLLCGHTHGGQIRLPFFGAIVVPSAHEGLYASGFHRIRGVLMYVSRGLGAVPPLRILCRPELATFTLRRGMRA